MEATTCTAKISAATEIQDRQGAIADSVAHEIHRLVVGQPESPSSFLDLKIPRLMQVLDQVSAAELSSINEVLYQRHGYSLESVESIAQRSNPVESIGLSRSLARARERIDTPKYEAVYARTPASAAPPLSNFAKPENPVSPHAVGDLDFAMMWADHALKSLTIQKELERRWFEFPTVRSLVPAATGDSQASDELVIAYLKRHVDTWGELGLTIQGLPLRREMSPPEVALALSDAARFIIAAERDFKIYSELGSNAVVRQLPFLTRSLVKFDSWMVRRRMQDARHAQLFEVAPNRLYFESEQVLGI